MTWRRRFVPSGKRLAWPDTAALNEWICQVSGVYGRSIDLFCAILHPAKSCELLIPTLDLLPLRYAEVAQGVSNKVHVNAKIGEDRKWLAEQRLMSAWKSRTPESKPHSEQRSDGIDGPDHPDYIFKRLQVRIHFARPCMSEAIGTVCACVSDELIVRICMFKAKTLGNFETFERPPCCGSCFRFLTFWQDMRRVLLFALEMSLGIVF